MIKSLTRAMVALACLMALMAMQLSYFLHLTPRQTTRHYSNDTTTALGSQRNITLPPSRHSRTISLRVNEIVVPLREETSNHHDRMHMVFVFPGVPGSRLSRHPQEREILEEVVESQRDPLKGAKVQLIHWDTPGMGHSSMGSEDWLFEKRTYMDTALDVKHVLRGLVKKDGKRMMPTSFSVIGIGTGSNHALAVASLTEEYGNELDVKFTGATLIAPVGPASNGEELCVSSMEKLSMRVMRDYTWGTYAVRKAWAVMTQLGLITPHYKWRILFDPCGNEENALLDSSEWTTVFNDTMIEMFRQGTEGYLAERALLLREGNLSGINMNQLPDVPLLLFSGRKAQEMAAAENIIARLAPAKPEWIKSDHNGIYSLLHYHWQQALASDVMRVKQERAPNRNDDKPESVASDNDRSATVHTTATTTTPTMSESKPMNEKKATTIVVVGGGLAGLSAVIESVHSGAQRVILLEKEARVAGNSAKASSGINAVQTPAQKHYGIEDRYEWLAEDTLKSGKGLSNESLVDTLSRDSTDAVAFLERHGIVLNVVSQCGGHSKPRTHRNGPTADGRIRNVGGEIIGNLLAACTKNERISPHVEVITQATATDLLTEGDGSQKRVVGVRYEKDGSPHDIHAHSVILTTGGFASDRSDFLNKYAPQYVNLPTSNGAFATGDGIKMVERANLNVDLIDMTQVQIHPTCFVDHKNPHAKTIFLAAEALRAYGGILLDKHGKRYVNELGMRDEVSSIIFKHCEPETEDGPVITYMLLNDEGAKGFGEKLLGFYRSKGLIQTFANFTDMIQNGDLPTAMQLSTLKETVQEYNECHAGKKKDKYGKVLFPSAFSVDSTIHMMRITPGLHYTMGGLRINNGGQVLRGSVTPIEGLFAAGEVTGGVHGANRLAGNSLLECVVFARRAARLAVKD